MKILALESSATACSVALCEDEALIAQSFQNNGLTHSRTLMPMAVSLLDNCGTALDAVELIAVAAGPGSFTGLRIGVAAAKGLAWPGNKPCAACSTLESMAWCLAHLDGEICAVMDARRNQVYNARFRAAGGRLERLCPDRAVGLDALADELKRAGIRNFWLETAHFYAILPSRNWGWTSGWRLPTCGTRVPGGCPVCTGADQSGQADRRGRTDAQLPPALPSGTGAAGKEQHKGESCHGHGKSTHFGPPSAAAQAVHPAG